MTAYNKLFAAIFSTLLTRWLLDAYQIDAVSLGISTDLQALVSLAIDSGAAAFNGFWVWLLPNTSK